MEEISFLLYEDEGKIFLDLFGCTPLQLMALTDRASNVKSLLILFYRLSFVSRCERRCVHVGISIASVPKGQCQRTADTQTNLAR